MNRPTLKTTYVTDEMGIRRQVVERVAPVAKMAAKPAAARAAVKKPSKSEPAGSSHEPGDELAESAGEA